MVKIRGGGKGTSALKTVTMTADKSVANAYTTDAIFLGDDALDIVYYIEVDGVKKTLKHPLVLQLEKILIFLIPEINLPAEWSVYRVHFLEKLGCSIKYNDIHGRGVIFLYI